MKTTKELLARALNTHPARHWCDLYKISDSALSVAKKKGHLSPALAGNLAIDLGEDARKWMIVASLETERNNQLNERLRKRLGVNNS